MDISLLVNLSSRAWSLDILAALASGTPGRQTTLLSATGAGRSAFAGSLANLLDMRLIERNPGHGHPLRPEFRLTADGERAAGIACRIKGLVHDPSEGALIRRTWTVPILAVTDRPRFFGEIRHELRNISDRSLSGSLRQLEDRRWIRRHVDVEARPPRPTYEAADLGADLSLAIGLAPDGPSSERKASRANSSGR
ncbi:transcriptional regulator [Salipiger sp. IMCC34102]|uniref:winged helix-turn-helix transcriptional regulator n=1 Tax=Salipiger sp. IMCC34102 TaxID=2510647 RepID=UPI00101C1D23|nr:winged helix-turn-helix transcriptional regulator [Salipiger sp. IMCC34102]RYH02221.1 transcriptional regulator [Salipiger sp. IMCC34102]